MKGRQIISCRQPVKLAINSSRLEENVSGRDGMSHASPPLDPLAYLCPLDQNPGDATGSQVRLTSPGRRAFGQHPWTIRSHTCASVSKQYNLALAYGQ